MSRHYRTLVVWQRAMDFAAEIYGIAPRLPKDELYGMKSQMTRAAVSIASNIAEGAGRESLKEKAHFLAISQGSLAETNTYVELCKRLGWIQASQVAQAEELADEVGRMLTKMRSTLRSRLQD